MKLFLSGGDDIFLVAKELRDQEMITMFPQLTSSLRDIDIKVVDINEIADAQTKQQAMASSAYVVHEVGEYLSKAVENLPIASKKEFISYAPGFVFNNILNLSMIIHALDKAQPDIAILHNDVEPLTRIVAEWCRVNNKPCVHLPHAVYLDYERGSVGSDIHDMVTASHLASAGPYQSNWYTQRGMKNIVETGIPRFDRLVKLPYNRDRACQLLHLNPANPVITYFSSWRQSTNLLGCNDSVEESYMNFLGAAKEIPNLQVIVKTHPRGGNLEWHIKQAHDSGLQCIVTDKYLDTVLMSSNVCISYGPSNVLLEAAILGKALVAVGGFGNEVAVLSIKNDKESYQNAIIDSLQSPRPLQEFVAKYTGKSDGHATQRVAEFIKSL